MTTSQQAEQIKQEAISNGVPDWYFDEINDECLVQYSANDILKLYEESQME